MRKDRGIIQRRPAGLANGPRCGGNPRLGTVAERPADEGPTIRICEDGPVSSEGRPERARRDPAAGESAHSADDQEKRQESLPHAAYCSSRSPGVATQIGVRAHGSHTTPERMTICETRALRLIAEHRRWIVLRIRAGLPSGGRPRDKRVVGRAGAGGNCFRAGGADPPMCAHSRLVGLLCSYPAEG